MNGILNLLKPTAMTSHDCIYAVRRLTGEKKVGHTGTLDPMAAGVLPIMVGNATKFSQYLIEKEKTYRTSLLLGRKTDTGDIYGNLLEKVSVKPFTLSQVETVLFSTLGRQIQIPPMYAAIKVNGRKLYELARKGKEVEREGRAIEINSIRLISYEHPVIHFEVTCSKGTYIRTLCETIAEKLDTIGTMHSLIRTGVFSLGIQSANTLEELEQVPAISERLSAIENFLPFKRYDLEEESRLHILLQTGYLPEDDKFILHEKHCLYAKKKFIGVLEAIQKKGINTYYLKTRI